MGSMKQSFTGMARYDEELLDRCEKDDEEDTAGRSVFLLYLLRMVRHNKFGDGSTADGFYFEQQKRPHAAPAPRVLHGTYVERSSRSCIGCGYSLPLLYYARIQMCVCASVWVTFLTHLSLCHDRQLDHCHRQGNLLHGRRGHLAGSGRAARLLPCLHPLHDPLPRGDRDRQGRAKLQALVRCSPSRNIASTPWCLYCVPLVMPTWLRRPPSRCSCNAGTTYPSAYPRLA